MTKTLRTCTLLLTVAMLLLGAVAPAMAKAEEPPIIGADASATGYIGTGTANAKVPIYDKAVKGKKIGTLAKGEVFYARQIWGKMLLVDKEDLTQGFIAADKANTSFDIQYTFVVTKKAAAYSEPKASKKLQVATLAKGDEVVLLALTGKWAKVLSGDEECYMLFSSLKMLEE